MRKSATITEVLDGEYREYGLYTVEHRAIPSAVDGFKPAQRKAAWTAHRIWKTGQEKPIRVFELMGRMTAECAYHHGEQAANATIVGMAQSFRNSVAILEPLGQFGSMRAPEHSAPRYIKTRLAPAFRLLYRDFELLEPRQEDGVPIEPAFMLPIVPTVLLNGTSGIAVGFATNILNREPVALVEACLAALHGKKFKEPMPWWREFFGTVERKDGQFVMSGRWERVDSTTLRIIELPPSMTLARYEEVLDKLVEKGTINGYTDASSGTPNYTVKLGRAALASLIAESKVEHTFKLTEADTENITCLDERGKLRVFSSATELVEYFVRFRLGYYDRRKARVVSDLTDRLSTLSNRARFVKLIVDGELKVALVPKADLVKALAGLKFDERDGSYAYLLGMPIHSLTRETYDQLMKERGEAETELKAARCWIPKDMYTEDLKALAKSLK